MKLPTRVRLARLWLHPHRYTWLRRMSMTLSLGFLVAVPLSGLARVDVWGGRHFLLGEPATFRYGLAGVIVGIAGLYVVTFLSNVVAGRLFCGWGCPVGQVSRFSDATEVAGLSRRARFRAHLEGATFSAFLVVAVFAWWIDLRVLWQGDPVWLAGVWGAVVLGVLSAYAHGRWWRWKFCMSACPIGLYYSFMAPANWFGIEFHADWGTCVECDACDKVCPVELEPRNLLAPIPARPGLSVPDAPGHNHCLECGDCVRACEWVVAKKTDQMAPLTLGYHERLDTPPVGAGESHDIKPEVEEVVTRG